MDGHCINTVEKLWDEEELFGDICSTSKCGLHCTNFFEIIDYAQISDIKLG